MNDAQKKLALFGALAFISVLVISFVPTAFKVGPFAFRKVDFASDIVRNEPVREALMAGKGRSRNNGEPLPAAGSKGEKGLVSAPSYMTFPGIINYGDAGNHPVPKFVQALKELQQGKRKTVRIAYFGDSFIEGDLISMDLRQLLQDHFGGSGGVGFVPVTSISASFRQTIAHSFSKDWKDDNFKSSNHKSGMFVSGHNFTSGGNSWVSYSAVNRPHLDSFQKVYLLYKSDAAAAVSVNGSVVNLPPAPGLGNVEIAAHTKKVLLANTSAAATLYGLSFENETGVLVDNFSFRGITGIEMQHIQADLLQQLNAVHPYDLIIFQYGPNLLFKPDLADFDFYAKPMEKAITQFRDAFPRADLLMLSTGDKAFRYNGQYATAKGVLPLLKVQNQIAQETGSNFWNLFVNMGGEGSMVHWVEGDTALANKDYTHVNFRGGKKIATLLYNTLMNAYEANN